MSSEIGSIMVSLNDLLEAERASLLAAYSGVMRPPFPI